MRAFLWCAGVIFWLVAGALFLAYIIPRVL